MASAFQSNAFQNNAFQIDAGVVVVDPHDGGSSKYYKYWKGLRDKEDEKRRKREARELEAIAEPEEDIPEALASHPIVPEAPRIDYSGIADKISAIREATLKVADDHARDEQAKTAKRRRDEEAILMLMG